MAKYKKNDKVKVRTDLEKSGIYSKMDVNDAMMEFRGKTVTIKKIINRDSPTYEIEEYGWMWGEDMFEDVSEFQTGDIIVKKGKSKDKKLYKVKIYSPKARLEGRKDLLIEDIETGEEILCNSKDYLKLEKSKTKSKKSNFRDKFIANKIKSIIKEINDNPDFKKCFDNVEKEVETWDVQKILNYKLNGEE